MNSIFYGFFSQPFFLILKQKFFFNLKIVNIIIEKKNIFK